MLATMLALVGAMPSVAWTRAIPNLYTAFTDDHLIYAVAGDEGRLRQLSAADGAELHATQLGPGCPLPAALANDGRGPVLLCLEPYREEGPNEHHVHPEEPKIWALDGHGHTRWSWPNPTTHGTLTCDAHGCLVGQMAGLAALDRDSGRARWSTGGLTDAIVAGRSYSTPALGRDAVFVGADDDDGQESLLALSRKTGRVSWEAPLHGSTYASRVRVAGKLVVLDTHGPNSATRLSAFDRRTGKLAWTTDVADDADFLLDPRSAVVVSGNAIAALALASGANRWRRDGERWRLGSQAEVGDAVLLWTLDGNNQATALLGLDARTGATRWSWPVPKLAGDGPTRVVGVVGGKVIVEVGDSLLGLAITTDAVSAAP